MLDRIVWHIPGRLIVVRYSGKITMDDLSHASAQLIAMMDSDGQPPYVHNITDVTAPHEIDHDMMNLRKMRDAATVTSHDLLGWTLIVDPEPNPVMRFLGTAIMQITNNRLRILTSMDDAIQFLHQVDQTLMDVG